MIDTEKARTTLRERVTLSLGSGSVEMALKIVDEVCDIASDAGDEWEGEIRKYYTSVTGANPFERPATRRRMQKARSIDVARRAERQRGQEAL